LSKIRFSPQYEYTSSLEEHPKPATNFVPKWFRDTPLFVSDGVPSNSVEKHLLAKTGSPSHGTYKLCVPVTDTVTLGYSIPLAASLTVKQTDLGYPVLSWNTPLTLTDAQPESVLANYPVPHGFNKSLFRWQTSWKIETPKGYSALVVHPFHRHDLPFMTLTGLIDTDVFPASLFLPFFLKEGFEGVIEAGTPIAQIIPVKRDKWISETTDFKPENKYWPDILKKRLIRSYKRDFWTRKVYR
jgi:hypothetical protein